MTSSLSVPCPQEPTQAGKVLFTTEKIILWMFATVVSQGTSKLYLLIVYPLAGTYTSCYNIHSNTKLVSLLNIMVVLLYLQKFKIKLLKTIFFLFLTCNLAPRSKNSCRRIRSILQRKTPFLRSKLIY